MIVTRELMIAAKGFVQMSWGQGDDNVLGADAKCFCVATACCAATRKTPFQIADPESASRDMILVFKDANGIPKDMPMGDWNDAPERTKDEVLSAFDKAIEHSADQKYAMTPDAKQQRQNRMSQKARLSLFPKEQS